ncbi:nucleoporin nup189 [Coprinopsis marcescibilis]|uniref:Nucleoporin nup189 n=1 Tax=Coprinopsis marcescibilis TaxID=230819 RepID=A0A5C3L1K6_COPMA|nr:nucleoporin nup189 [Coprinopsis marcescibilis]
MTRFRAYASESSSSDEDSDYQPTSTKPQAAQESDQSGSEEEESEEEVSDEEEDDDRYSSGSASSVRMLERELLYGKPRRPRTALVEDENGDIQLDGDEDVELLSRSSSSTSSRSSTPEHRGTNGDPNIIPWARQLGVDAQKMHVMQTSLFRMPEEAAALKALNQPKPGHKILNLQGSNGPLNRKHSRDSEGDGLRHDSRERASFAHDIEPAVYRPSRKYARVETNSTIAKGREGDYADAALAFGRSFRAGWGPGGALVHVGTICGPLSSPPSEGSSVLSITRRPFPISETQPKDSSPPALAQKLLQHHLSNTPITKDESEVPAAVPKPDAASSLNFASFASLFPATDAIDPAPLFRLGSALFDPIDLRLSVKSRGPTLPGATAITPDVRNKVTLLRRRVALSKWLETVVGPSVESEIRAKGSSSSAGSSYSPADVIYSQLTGHQVHQACNTAIDSGFVKLATLVSQAGGDDTFKAHVREQLDIWKQEKLSPADAIGLGGITGGLISKGIWKVYQLLAGPPPQDDASLSNWVQDVCSGLDWKRIFGLCLWYGTGIDGTVGDVVSFYQTLIHRYSTITIARPLPRWHTEGHAGQASADVANSSAPGPSRTGLGLLGSNSAPSTSKLQLEDPLYSLIRLHADPSLSLSQILDPHSFGPDERSGGLGMCWHLYIIISRVMRIRDFSDRTFVPKSTRANGLANGVGHGHSSDEESDAGDLLAREGLSPTADLLTNSYAFALESWGMVQEAAFVLLHLEASQGREKAIKDLLARWAPDMNEWLTRGLVGSLKIPITWVHEAKAIYALDQGNIFDAYELYLSAQLHGPAHDLAVLELAPDAILRRDLELLRELFEVFDLDGRRDKIEGWFVRGKVFIDYVDILTRVPLLLEQIQSEQTEEGEDTTIPDAAQTAELDDLTRKIPKLIALLPDVLHRPRAVDDRHCAAVEEMTQSLVAVMRKAKPGMLLKQPVLNFMDGATKINLIKGRGYARFLHEYA